MRFLILTVIISVLYQVKPEVLKMNKEPVSSQNSSLLFSFGLITDVQYADCDAAGTRFYRNSLVKLRSSMDAFNRNGVSFIVNLGDLIDRDFNSFHPVLQILDSSDLRTYHCTGNHDYNVEKDQKEKIPLAGSADPGYYSFSLKGFRLIFLNGNDISTYASDNEERIEEADNLLLRLKEGGSINAIDWNGGIGKEQLRWLDDQLDKSIANSEQVLIFCHFPVAPEDIHNLLNYREVLHHIQDKRNIAAWINGHNHAGNYAILDGTHFITFKGMVETEGINSFSIVQVYRDKILVRGFGSETDRTLLTNRVP